MDKLTSIIFLVHIVIIVGSFESASGSRMRSSYGEPCNQTTRCDSRQSLSCRGKTCDCFLSETMTFDTSKNKCLVLVGEKCSFTAVAAGGEVTDERQWREELACVANAMCSADGFCVRESNYFESTQDTCKMKQLYGNDCNSDVECREDLHLTCQAGKCDCNVTYSIFDVSKGKCITRAGASCYKLRDCPANGSLSRLVFIDKCEL